jgi:hypothetical protein
MNDAKLALERGMVPEIDTATYISNMQREKERMARTGELRRHIGFGNYRG